MKSVVNGNLLNENNNETEIIIQNPAEVENLKDNVLEESWADLLDQSTESESEN